MAACEVLIAWPARVKKEVLLKMKSLRMFQSLSAGVDALDFQALPPGVKVFSNAGAYSGPVGEHAWGLILGAAKGIYSRKVRVVPRRLAGGTLLVVGSGAIGSEVARLSKSIGMRTIGVSRSFPFPQFFDETFGTDDLRQVLGRADAVLISLPHSASTDGMFTYELLSLAKPNVIVANVGRGELVSEEGLLRWLKERPESRYATDVFWWKDGKESFETPAWDLPNFAGTLHISGLPLGESLEVPRLQAAKNVKAFLNTGNAKNQIDVKEYLSLKS
ncbi:MAG TPA: NAD(P)-dependent oxidoreductase [Nitrososphaerales archaeon]|nr:NAD(P)-dependent oxidoreductase [Nitrososphaerales archaeon]